MIYKCNNCGRTYNLKPEFCDCGNNGFYEVVENFDYSKVKTNFNAENEVDFLYNNQFLSELKYQKEQDYSLNQDLKKQKTAEIISISIFIVVFLSAVFIIFQNASKLITKSKNKTPTVEIENYIPSDVNEFWQEEKPTTNTTAAPKDIEKQQNNTNSVNRTNISKTNKKADTKSSLKTTSQKTSEPQKENLTKNTEKSNKVQTKKESKTEENTSPNNIEEYLKYKNNLRNKLFSKFPILTVQGQGSAKIAFSISADGKLTNRRFVSQSGNKSLDDAMYHMLMRVPIYSTPPNGFEGQEIIMQMDFNNGHYSFAFVN